MDIAILPALAGFVLAATITPGPNNIMLMASGATFGFRRTMPHLLGISVGASVMITLVGIGLMTLFDAVPALDTALKIVSVIYLLYLAWKIANAAPPETGSSNSHPLTSFQAAVFQWVNPKIWAMGVSAITLFAPAHSLVSVALVAFAFATIGLSANSIWAWIGTVVRRWLTSGVRLRMFNTTMALLLVASLYPLLMR